MFENWKVLKSEVRPEEYEKVAEWCNTTGNYTIIDDGEYYRVIPVEQPEEQPEAVENEQIVEDSGL